MHSFTCHCSLKSCSKCLWISHCLHYGLCHWDYSFEVSICTSKCLLQTLNFIVCALVLCTISGCQRRVWETEPKVPDYTHCGPKGSDGLAASSAVRKPGGVSRAWDIILRHPTLRGPLGSPPCSTAFPQRAVSAS